MDKPSSTFIHESLNFGTAGAWTLAYIVILWKVRKTNSAEGISLQTLMSLFFCEANNVLIQMIVAYRYSFSLSWAFWLCDIPTVLIAFSSWWYIRTNHQLTYERNRDCFGLKFMKYVLPDELANKYQKFFLYFIALILAVPLYIFRSSRLPFLISMLECFDDVLLAISLLPQLFMFYRRTPRRVSAPLANFVFLMFIARVCAFTYWLSYPWFRYSPGLSRNLRLCTEFLNLVILADFIYYFVRARLKGETDFILPL